MHFVLNILSFLIPLGPIFYAIDLFRKFGFVFYQEQFVAAMFGIAGGLVFFGTPINKSHTKKKNSTWINAILGIINILGWTYVSIYYPVLSELTAKPPFFGVLLAILLILLLLESLRRTAGIAITAVTLGFIILALIGHLLPGEIMGRKLYIDRLLYYFVWDSTAILGTPLKIVTTVVVVFVLFGQALFLSGGSFFFTDISNVLMGKYRGGPAKIAIVASSLFGTISGSAVANVISTGVVTIPLMKEAGYRPHISAAIEAVASTGGQLMPPVMGITAFVMAEFLQVPYASVVIAAILPSLLYYVALFIEADLEAGRYGIKRLPKDEIPPSLPVIKNGIHFSVPFIILIATIFWLKYPIEECGLFAVSSVVLLSIIIGYKGKRLNLKELFQIMNSTGRIVLDMFMIGAAAGIVIGALNISGLGFGLTLSLIHIAGGNLLILLAMTAVISIILGMGMPTLPVYILLATLVAPALIEMKIDPMATHLFILYYGMMSMITPPVAVAAFAAATLSGSDAMRTGYAAMRFGWTAFVIPFLFVFSKTLLMRGNPIYILIDIATAISGIWFISAAMIGYTFKEIGMLKRIIFAIAGAFLLIPIGIFTGARYINIAGAFLGALLLWKEFSYSRQTTHPNVF